MPVVLISVVRYTARNLNVSYFTMYHDENRDENTVLQPFARFKISTLIYQSSDKINIYALFLGVYTIWIQGSIGLRDFEQF